MTPRKYQSDSVDVIVRDFANRQGNSVVVLPTGSGKSLVIALSVHTLNTPCLILCPNREILAQNHEKLSKYVPESEIGVYSASFNRKDIRRYTLATIQSVYRNPEIFSGIQLVFVDECHLVAVRSSTSMYTDFFKAVGSPKVYGFTATPYRLEQAYEMVKNSSGTYDAYQSTMLKIITRTRHKSAKEIFWSRIVINVNHGELVSQGYLMPITYVENPLVEYKEIPVNKSKSDYDLDAYTDMIVGKDAVSVQVIKESMEKHKSTLVFCPSVEHAERLASVIDGAAVVSGKTPTKERARVIDAFKSGAIKVVLNCQVLTTGFDHPSLDSIVLLRPTRSPNLYNQMVGRLTRLSPGKTSATLYDLSDTVKAMGRVETFELFRNERGLTDLKTEKHPTWHDRVLFRMSV